MNKSKLLHIIPFAYFGGTEKDCYYFMEGCKSLDHRDWELDKEGPMVKEWESVASEIKVLNILDFSNKIILQKLSNELKTETFEGILYWSTIKLPLIRYALRECGCRLAVHVGNPASFKIPVMIKQIFEHIYYPSSIETFLFACSKYVAQTLKIHPYYRYFSHFVSYNPVRLLEENPYRLRKQYSREDKIIIGMTARLDPIKDHQTLLYGFREVLKSYPNAELWLMGDGVLRNTLEKLTEQLYIKGKVIFWGNVEDVYDKLKLLDIFVYSTTPREGLGNAVSEAMACGLPCIISDLPMMREIDGNAQASIFFTPGNVRDLINKIMQLLRDDELRLKLSKNAFHRAKEAFNVENYVKTRLKFLLNNKIK